MMANGFPASSGLSAAKWMRAQFDFSRIFSKFNEIYKTYTYQFPIT